MAFFSAVIPRLCLSAFTIMQPLLVDKITTYAALPEAPETRDKGYGLIAASGIVYLGIAVSTAFYSRQTYRFIISIRGSLLAAVYAQTLKRRSGEMGTDTAITLMGTDVERISTSLRDIHDIWASPIDIGLALWLLERQLAVSCLMPVILSLGIVRGNIVDPLNFEPEWYRHVLWMCCLAEDVEALPEKDLTRIGGQGFMLSGGQKQRLALARAVYSGCEMVVLDDIFSGLDAANINKICERLLDRHKGYLRCRDITVILSTHNAKVAAFADDVYILKEGTVATYKPSASSTPSSGHQTSFPDDNEFKSRPASPKQQASQSVDAEVSSDDNAPEPKQTVSRPVKDRSVYLYYLKSAGLGLSILYIVLVLVFAFSQNFSTLWLKWWSDASTESPDGAHWMYLGVFIALGLGAVIIGAASSWYILSLSTCAPLFWLSEANSGDILNRFNQDLELTDMTLPLAAINTTKALGACLLKMIILFVVANYMSLTVPPLLIVCYFLQRYYLRTSRQVRLLSIETKAPLYQHLSETLSGVSTIRAFRRQQWFERNNLLFVDDSQKCVYTLFMIQQWLTLSMDLLACGLVVLLMILIVFSRDSFDSGSSGTAIVTLMSFTQSLARLLKFWSLTESCLGAVSRIKTFAETVPSEAQSKHSDADSSFSMHEKVTWPSQGAIEFVNVVAAYRSHPVLKSVSMHIEPGDKVAICGRSGSGKSSLVLCLGGLLPIQSGSVQIDGVDLSNVCSEDILKRLSVVPQDPCFLPGTIRLNIDPDEALSEAAVEGVLKATHLSAIVQNMGGLDAELEPGLWSAGQGQLMALARAMARRSRILILDEAMGRVDAATQSLMERIVASHFNDCTILSIMHRYENISAFDKIALFEDGVLVEFDRPESLLSQETSHVVIGNNRYKSRPDLSPPRLNITIPPTHGLEQGYIFIAPFNAVSEPAHRAPQQPGAYILSDNGDLVWSGYTYFSTWTGNFQATRWNGQDVLASFEGAHNGLYGHGHGHHVLLNQRYETIKELRAGNHLLSDKHEFEILNESTALIQIHHPEVRDLSNYTSDRRQHWIVNAIFQELDINDGKVLFEWRSLDHIGPEESALPLPKDQAGIGHNSSTAWDYFHINSVTKGIDGHYLVSARHASTVYKINSTDGSVIWRLGGSRSDFTLGPEVEFGFQHHARLLNQVDNSSVTTITLFDNAVYGSESGGGGDKEVQIYPYSRGKILKLDHHTRHAALESSFIPPDLLLVKSQGSLQTLPNGNVFINWGSEGAVTEFSSDGEPLYHAYLDSRPLSRGDVQNYRAFRANWTGISSEEPAVVAFQRRGAHGGNGGTDIYLSWNGDTETAEWRLQFQVDSGDSLPIGWSEDVRNEEFETTATRQGFETVHHVPFALRSVLAQAIAADGKVLASSNRVQVQAWEVYEYLLEEDDFEAADPKAISPGSHLPPLLLQKADQL
ncbi:ASST-domain-containing protein [Aspergillus welwitschiae]|uniref:ASST-domain-containing protein n=1 Tax=Aspergillus welwitschiae TaxID=1341132 RepID=A0A3F3PM74_9EURO|nr:ASST-domain-containing protein [Aspergillus welwitschiae]RDH28017.1 ASST-domain-containing protein [Aspergillus welwitschiae]